MVVWTAYPLYWDNSEVRNSWFSDGTTPPQVGAIKGWLNYEDARSAGDLDQSIWTSIKFISTNQIHLTNVGRCWFINVKGLVQVVPAKKKMPVVLGMFLIGPDPFSFALPTSPLFVFNRFFCKGRGANRLLSNQLPSECFDPSLRNNNSGIGATNRIKGSTSKKNGKTSPVCCAIE